MNNKRVIIVHGWEGGTHEPQLVWLRDELVKRGYVVVLRDFPDSDTPRIEAWVSFLKEISGGVDQNTHFIGHSVGCQTILRYLADLSEGKKIGRVILVAPWLHLLPATFDTDDAEDIARPWIDIPINWNQIRVRAQNFSCFLSDDDPYVPVSDAEEFRKNLGAKIILEHGFGHYNEASGVFTLPQVLEQFNNG